MPTLKVHDVLPDKILISRESARALEGAIRALYAGSDGTRPRGESSGFVVDFDGIEGIAPSFLDELISVLESSLDVDAKGAARSIIVAHPPTRLSLKFEAVARAHRMTIRAQPDGSWLLSA
jgi:hypothetical protein